MSDEIKAGDKFMRVGRADIIAMVAEGDVATALRPDPELPGDWRVLINGKESLFSWRLDRAEWWKRLPREEAKAVFHEGPAVIAKPTIEERRAALKHGDRITDPALLCEGMRVRYAEEGFVDHDEVITSRDVEWNGWNAKPMALFMDNGSYWEEGRVTFLAHPEAKAEPSVLHMLRRSGVACGHGPAGPGETLEATLTEARVTCKACLEAIKPRVTFRSMVSDGENWHDMTKPKPGEKTYATLDALKKAAAEEPKPRCAPGCTPSNACRTEGVCKVFEEERVAAHFWAPGQRMSSWANDKDETDRMRAESRHGFSSSGFGGMAGGVWRVK